jgi:hypothetical protein
MKKYWLLIIETDAHSHKAARVHGITESVNLVAYVASLPKFTTVNICPSQKAARDTAERLNHYFHIDGEYKYDFMDDGTTPAPF